MTKELNQLRTLYRGLQWLLRNMRRIFKLLGWLATGQFSRAGNALLPYYQRYVPLRIQGMVPDRVRYAVAQHLLADETRLSQNASDARKKAVAQRTGYVKFDSKREREFNHKMANVFEKSRSRFEAMKVSVVMPTYNRQHMIGRAVESVIRQSHKNWELIIVDDGSTDDTAEVVNVFLQDKRIEYTKQQHLGLSTARNSGLKLASGQIVAYLDTDNVWRPNFLRNMVVFMTSEGYKCAYAGLVTRNERGQIIYYRGREFDWDSCLKANYIDLNVYCHSRDLYESGLRFDENLRRMVDWDLILSHARKVSHQVGYAPFIGCDYLGTRDNRDRVSVRQPLAFGKIIRLKHSSSSELGPRIIAEQLSLKIGIKIAAPRHKRLEWGDYHYADSLAAAFRKLGHSVRIDFLGEHYNQRFGQDDIAIVLRGLTNYEPQPGTVNIMWNISHPDQVAYSEYDKYDLVYVASLTYPNFLRYVTKVPVRALLQATDTERFQPLSEKDPRYTDEIIFVGNSRNEYRKIVKWAVEKGLPLAIYGTNWEQFVPSGLIKASNISNESLPALYFSAKAVLNDHWESMAEYGFLSNRLFDVIAAGGRVISDAVPSLQTVFGGAVTEVRNAEELECVINRISSEETQERQDYVARSVAANHSFDSRAKEIVDDTLKFLGLPTLYEDDMKREECHSAAPAVNTNKPLKVNAFARWDGEHPRSSAFIRLLSPLTSEALAGGIELKLIPASDSHDAEKGDVYIIQRTAFDNREAAEALVDEIRKEGSRLIVDNDDAFCLMDPSHPELDFHSDKNSALVYLMEMADETWFATPALAEAYSNHSTNPEVMPDAIDPRIWRNYRKKWRPIGSNKKLRMVYMGTGTNDGDFEVILPALDEIARMRTNSFELTIIGAVKRPPNRRWLQNVSPPRTATAYPRFARWLLQQPAWDVGLAPLADTPFNNCESDIKFLEYTALAVVSVLSDCAPYRASAVESSGAILVKNSTDNWRDTFLNLTDNLTQFRYIVDAAWEYIWSKRHVSVLAHQQMMALRRITL
jgi:glycosyltransferase involved in cell wall biosynthesis